MASNPPTIKPGKVFNCLKDTDPFLFFVAYFWLLPYRDLWRGVLASLQLVIWRELVINLERGGGIGFCVGVGKRRRRWGGSSRLPLAPVQRIKGLKMMPNYFFYLFHFFPPRALWSQQTEHAFAIGQLFGWLIKKALLLTSAPQETRLEQHRHELHYPPSSYHWTVPYYLII